MADAVTRTALVVRGGWFGHQPVEATEPLLPFLREQGFDVRVEESPAVYADREYMDGVDLILQLNTMSTIEKDEFEGLRSAVESGTGLAGWHGGIADSYRNSSDYLQFIGAQFAAHPGKHPDERTGEQSDNYLPHTITMLPAAAEHPITRGIERLRTDHRAVLGAARRLPRRARHHDAGRASLGPVDPSDHVSRHLDQTVGRGPDVRVDPRPPGGDPREPERSDDHRKGTAVGGPLKVGVVGVGVISDQYFATIPGLSSIELVAVADLNEARAREVAEARGLSAMPVDALLDDPGVDIVLNLTIPAAHAEVDIRALESGKHVFGEKPLAVTVADGARILAAAAGGGPPCRQRARHRARNGHPDRAAHAGLRRDRHARRCGGALVGAWPRTVASGSAVLLPAGWRPAVRHGPVLPHEPRDLARSRSCGCPATRVGPLVVA